MAVGGLASGYFRLEQIERSAFEREGDKTGFRSAGVFLSGIPANAPSGCDRQALAVGAGDPAFTRGHHWKISMGLRFHRSPSWWRSVPRVLRRGVMIISLGAAPGRDESRDDASANRPPESFINGHVFTLKGLTLAR